jgi:hypothetical protein
MLSLLGSPPGCNEKWAVPPTAANPSFRAHKGLAPALVSFCLLRQELKGPAMGEVCDLKEVQQPCI